MAMVLDLNKCLGCHTCSIACKTQWTKSQGKEAMWWNTVNTMPGEGTPRGWEDMGGGFHNAAAQPGQMPTTKGFGEAWEFNYDQVFREGQGQEEHLQVVGEAPDWGPNWDEDEGAGDYPNSYHFYLPRLCNHCTHPACVAACPRQAIEKREADGIVVINEERCRGYRFCMEACPYKKIYFNHAKQVSQKCIFCYPRLEQGVATACSRQCPGRVRFLGYKDDEEGPIYKLVTKYKLAVPLHPEYGTEPNVFYVPPTGPLRIGEDGDVDESQPRIPTAYIHKLFGDAGIEALENLEREKQVVQAGGKSEALDVLIAYKWEDMFGGFDRNPATIKWV
jgi:ethylbenzene hydroxylase subunit beta/complex iron-sulfur molybdoenzyme family reductase subunit beta